MWKTVARFEMIAVSAVFALSVVVYLKAKRNRFGNTLGQKDRVSGCTNSTFVLVLNIRNAIVNFDGNTGIVLQMIKRRTHVAFVAAHFVAKAVRNIPQGAFESVWFEFIARRTAETVSRVE